MLIVVILLELVYFRVNIVRYAFKKVVGARNTVFQLISRSLDSLLHGLLYHINSFNVMIVITMKECWFWVHRVVVTEPHKLVYCALVWVCWTEARD